MDVAVQLDQFHENAPPFNSIFANASVLQFWSLAKLGGAKELASLVLPLFRITASEASTERTFSQQKLVHRATRTSLSHENVEAEVFIRMNLPKFKKPPQFVSKKMEVLEKSHSDSESEAEEKNDEEKRDGKKEVEKEEVGDVNEEMED